MFLHRCCVNNTTLRSAFVVLWQRAQVSQAIKNILSIISLWRVVQVHCGEEKRGRTRVVSLELPMCLRWLNALKLTPRCLCLASGGNPAGDVPAQLVDTNTQIQQETRGNSQPYGKAKNVRNEWLLMTSLWPAYDQDSWRERALVCESLGPLSATTLLTDESR